MNKKECFIINERILYYELSLIEFERIPMLFVCSHDKQYYIALCTDIDELEYVVVSCSLLELYLMLNGTIPVRQIFEMQGHFYLVSSGATIDEDVVLYKGIDEIDSSALPLPDAYYKILTNDVKQFYAKIEREIYSRNDYVQYQINKAEPDSDYMIRSIVTTSITEEKNANLQVQEKSSYRNMKFSVKTDSGIESKLKKESKTRIIESELIKQEQTEGRKYSIAINREVLVVYAA